jgi:DNA replication protein DnaC
LAVAAGDGSAPRLLTALAKVDLLTLDDFGLADLSTKQGRDLLDVIDERAGHRSPRVAIPWPLDRWHGVIEDATVADALLDRLIHHVHKMVMQGDSLRKQGTA